MSNASIYAVFLPGIRHVALEMGWAVAVYGSMQRDLDLVAFPMAEDAKPRAELVEALCARFSFLVKSSEQKLWRRQAVELRLPGTDLYLDLSFFHD